MVQPLPWLCSPTAITEHHLYPGGRTGLQVSMGKDRKQQSGVQLSLVSVQKGESHDRQWGTQGSPAPSMSCSLHLMGHVLPASFGTAGETLLQSLWGQVHAGITTARPPWASSMSV